MLSLVLRNRGRSTCVLHGYPRLALLDARGPLPFVVSRNGDQVVTTHRPVKVVVRPGGSAFVLADEYRCDRGDRRKKPLSVSLQLPGSTGPAISLGLDRNGGDLSWCGRGDPGSTLAVSPFEPILAAATRR